MTKIEQIGIDKFEEFYGLFIKMAEYSIALGHPGVKFDFDEEKKQKIKQAFAENRFECHILYENDTPIGYLSFYETYSTFLAKIDVYMDDIFVLDEHRGKGYGTLLINRMREIAKERDYGRIDWHTPQSNELAQKFYEKMGALNCHSVRYRFTPKQY